ncbi:MAG TPA: hypothetical protein IAB13_03725 [Candidatus Avanaerovorax faecigallinarum]|nr:hypothetical protein [Candidatus Avanaerovorax faecigallinarum]
MKVNRKFFARAASLALALSIGIMTGCSTSGSDDSEFPTDEAGYPDKDAVMINGEVYETGFGDEGEDSGYEMSMQVKVADDGSVTVVLPQIIPTHTWNMEEKEDVILKSFETTKTDVTEPCDGPSDTLQSFTFIAESGSTVLFKWVNVNEAGKAFSEKAADREIRVTVS